MKQVVMWTYHDTREISVRWWLPTWASDMFETSSSLETAEIAAAKYLADQAGEPVGVKMQEFFDDDEDDEDLAQMSSQADVAGLQSLTEDEQARLDKLIERKRAR